MPIKNRIATSAMILIFCFSCFIAYSKLSPLVLSKNAGRAPCRGGNFSTFLAFSIIPHPRRDCKENPLKRRANDKLRKASLPSGVCFPISVSERFRVSRAALLDRAFEHHV
ncbi:MAG: hypothetical protein IKN53_05935, partial [Oscillibacter sp.]|nr:hypothetical protein [Oscillibacter sp.]